MLVDALDEAVAGHSIGIAAHLRTLARCPDTRFVVGTRPSPALGATLGGSDALLGELDPDIQIDLEDAKDATADIERVLQAALTEPTDSPYAGADIAELAAEVAAWSTPSFLVAQTAARWLLGRPKPITVELGWPTPIARFVADRQAEPWSTPTSSRVFPALTSSARAI